MREKKLPPKKELKLLLNRYTYAQVAPMYKVHTATVCKWAKRYSIQRSMKGSCHPKAQLEEKDVPLLFALKGSMIAKEAGEKFLVSESIVYGVWNYHYWYHITKNLKDPTLSS